MHRVVVHTEDRMLSIEAKEGKSLLGILQENSIFLEAPCGSRGICGKCKVLVFKEGKPYLENITEEERRILTSDEIQKGTRLACCLKLFESLEVFLPYLKQEARILSNLYTNKFEVDSDIITEKVVLERPTLDDQKSYFSRLKSLLGRKDLKVSHSVLKKLAEFKDEEFFVVLYNDEIIDITKSENLFGLAIDIGTTTVVCYLVDLLKGNVVDYYSFVNPQKKFGADVISRIDFAAQQEDGLSVLQKEIIKGINEAIRILTSRLSITKDEIYKVVAVGNPTMLHLLLGVDPVSIATSPFVPVFAEKIEERGQALGLEINKNAILKLPGSLSAYVGADIVAGILSTEMHKSKKVRLLLDLGTNGEMVLGNKDFMVAASAAAGPAFEGVNLSCGMNASSGAIDSIKIKDGKIEFTTIENTQPKGICGSGTILAVAFMLEEGIIDETGRFCEDVKEKYKDNFRQANGQDAFFITDSVYITQKDIREIQLAKAAISAGIKTMLKEAGLSEDDIETVYLAGGFGNYISPWAAIKIGLIPEGLKDKVKPAGNTAGNGAILALLSKSAEKEFEKIKKRVKYIELSSSPEFNELFVESMIFDQG
ncbi:ASKHA domain-containing protein [Caldicellulosiruptor naganoensis]|uniref:ASKHA domain-containing protein n=1 Tax=Caldicellulosiruptor naganoensis TaxID=29324 RepID=A0ABY7BH08_9FIRM|nr:ASKHA domain-containing protein [Caldicellulosiruptor naganoensis]WAM31874.1 ASKHA domain-containing protein [Caldicellulosiruptor naganoensis]